MFGVPAFVGAFVLLRFVDLVHKLVDPDLAFRMNVDARPFLSNLPTLVLGTSSMNAHRSGTCQCAILAARKSCSTAASTVASGTRTTVASGRSPHFGSGTPTTEASMTSGWAMRAFSRSTELIHSPPDLMTSLARSVSSRKPSGGQRADVAGAQPAVVELGCGVGQLGLGLGAVVVVGRR